MGIFLGNMNPDSVFTSDIGSVTRLATSAPFSRYLIEEIYERNAFIRSGVMQTVGFLNGTTGTRVEVPRFNPLNYTEEQVRSDDSWGTSGSGHYTSQKTTATTEYATITTRGAMFSADDLSRYQTGEDALSAIRSQLATDMDRKMTAKLLSHLTGLVVDAAAPLHATNFLDKSQTVAGTETEANFINVANITEAKYKLGERNQSLTTIAIHPNVAAYLEQVGQLVFSTDALSTGGNIQWGSGGVGVTSTQIGWMSGLQVIVDSQLPILGATGENEQYVSLLFGPGAVLTGQQFPLMIETERNIASLQDVLAVTYSSAMHVPGTTWASATDNPLNADLANPANFGLTYTDPRLIPMVALVTNSPFGGVLP